MYNPYFNNAFPNNNSIYNPVSAGMGYSQLNKQENITEVYGFQGAQAYQMGPNSSAILLDANEPMVYIKRTDGAGSASIMTYDLTLRQSNGGTSELEKRVRKLEEIINESYTGNASTASDEQPIIPDISNKRINSKQKP